MRRQGKPKNYKQLQELLSNSDHFQVRNKQSWTLWEDASEALWKEKRKSLHSQKTPQKKPRAAPEGTRRAECPEELGWTALPLGGAHKQAQRGAVRLSTRRQGFFCGKGACISFQYCHAVRTLTAPGGRTRQHNVTKSPFREQRRGKAGKRPESPLYSEHRRTPLLPHRAVLTRDRNQSYKTRTTNRTKRLLRYSTIVRAQAAKPQRCQLPLGPLQLLPSHTHPTDTASDSSRANLPPSSLRSSDRATPRAPPAGSQFTRYLPAAPPAPLRAPQPPRHVTLHALSQSVSNFSCRHGNIASSRPLHPAPPPAEGPPGCGAARAGGAGRGGQPKRRELSSSFSSAPMKSRPCSREVTMLPLPPRRARCRAGMWKAPAGRHFLSFLAGSEWGRKRWLSDYGGLFHGAPSCFGRARGRRRWRWRSERCL